MGTKTTTNPQQAQPRTLETIQREIATAIRFVRLKEAERKKRLAREHRSVHEAMEVLQAAQANLSLAIADDAATQAIGDSMAMLESLKREVAAIFKPHMERTWKEPDGAGFQFRPKAVTNIADQPALAAYLVQHKLWQAAGANITVDPHAIAEVMEEYPLPGISVDLQVTVAIYQPKET